MRGHERREERRDERQTFGARGNADRYQMREKMLSIGDDFWIEDESWRRAFKVNGKALFATLRLRAGCGSLVGVGVCAAT